MALIEALWPKVKRLEKAQAAGGMGSFRIDAKAVKILPLSAYTFTGGMLSRIFDNIEVFAKVGTLITVSLDGVEYQGTTKFAMVSAGDTLIPSYYVGNLGMFGLEDTGEHFAVVLSKAEYGIQAVLLDELAGGVEDSTHTVSIHAAGEVPKPIDPKFIPGAVLPVVELTTVPLFDGTEQQLTENEGAALAAAANSAGCVIVLPLGDIDGVPVVGKAVTGFSGVEFDGIGQWFAEFKVGQMSNGMNFSTVKIFGNVIPSSSTWTMTSGVE